MKFTLAFMAAVGVALAQDTTPSLTDLLSGNENLTSLVTLLQSQPTILEALGSAENITIFAPNNDALTAFTEANAEAIEANPDLVAAVLQYHVLPSRVYSADILAAGAPLFPQTLLDEDDFEQVEDGQYVKVQVIDENVYVFSGLENNATVVTADQNFTAGVVHIIDSVLTLPVNVSETAIAAGLSSLAGALNETDLIETVDHLENVTIFAPNNAAFRAIASVLESADAETITAVLQYHIVNGSVAFSTDLVADTNLTSLSGESIAVTQEGENFFVNGALIGTPNILVAGGVVHVIDQVLNPANTTGPTGGASAGEVQFPNATASEEDPLTSGVPVPTTSLQNPPTGTGASGESATPSNTGAAGKVAVPVFGAVAGLAAFLL